MSNLSLTNRINRIAEYTETRNVHLHKKMSGMSDTRAQKLIERELPEVLALNFINLRQCVQLRNQIVFQGAKLFRQQIPMKPEIVSMMSSLEELSKNRIAAALNVEQLAQESGIMITSEVLLTALSGRKVRRFLTDSDLAYFRSLQPNDPITVKSFMEAYNAIPRSSIRGSK